MYAFFICELCQVYIPSLDHVIAPYEDEDSFYFGNLLQDTPFEVRVEPHKGRGLYAKCDFQEGETVFTEKPFASTEAWENDSLNYCHNCYKPLEYTKIILGDEHIRSYAAEVGSEKFQKLKENVLQSLNISRLLKTSHAQSQAHFCSDTCHNDYIQAYEIQDSALSFPEITAIPHSQKSFIHPIEHTTSNMIARLSHLISKDSSLWFQTLRRMSYSEDISEFELTDTYRNIQYSLLNTYPTLKEIILNDDAFKKLISIIFLNGFNLDSYSTIIVLSKPNDEVVVELIPNVKVSSVSMYKVSSLFNHSCDPNIGSTSPILSNRLKWIALRPIKKGEEILNSYVQTEHPYDVRQQLLKDHYKFECQCSKCKAEGLHAS